MKFWRFHGFHTETTEVSPLLLLNYGITDLHIWTLKIRRSLYFLRNVGNTVYGSIMGEGGHNSIYGSLMGEGVGHHSIYGHRWERVLDTTPYMGP